MTLKNFSVAVEALVDLDLLMIIKVMVSKDIMEWSLGTHTTMENSIDLTGNLKAVKEKFPLRLFFDTMT